MNVHVRMQRSFFDLVVDDLSRPHSFAAERVGFVFAERALAGSGHCLLFPVDYKSVQDDAYIPDNDVGVCFGTSAIRDALQTARTTGMSCLQVHLHDHSGQTHFSAVDVKTIDQLAVSLAAVAPQGFHGGLVFSRDNATARIWDAEKPRSRADARVSIVGFPFVLGPRSR
jgi:hypothetical protein